MIKTVLDDLRMNKIESIYAIVDKDNTPSFKALTNAGFLQEGFINYQKSILIKAKAVKEVSQFYLLRKAL